MKKFTIIWLLIVFVLSFKTIHAQDLTETQRKERCENNKKRLAELETQLRVNEAALSRAWTEKEREDGRNDIQVIKQASRKGLLDLSPEIMNNLQRIERKHNWDYYACLEKYNDNHKGDRDDDVDVAFKKCLYELQVLIANKIVRATVSNRPEIIAKKNDLEKQIAFHKNNLVALGCNENSTGTNANWNGTFVDSYGSVSITSSGTSMSASFTSQGPENNWKNVGQWSGCKVTGNTAKCNWTCSYSDNDKTGTRKGTLEITISGNNISGSYSEDTPSFNWKPGITDKFTKMSKGAVWPFSMKRK